MAESDATPEDPPLPPCVVVHGLADIRKVLRPGLPLTLLSAPGAAGYAGAGWWMALADAARGLNPGLIAADFLDCGDAPGYALAALRMGQSAIILYGRTSGFAAVAAMAAERRARLLAARPACLDIAQLDWTRRDADKHVERWLRHGTDDTGPSLG